MEITFTTRYCLPSSSLLRTGMFRSRWQCVAVCFAHKRPRACNCSLPRALTGLIARIGHASSDKAPRPGSNWRTTCLSTFSEECRHTMEFWHIHRRGAFLLQIFVDHCRASCKMPALQGMCRNPPGTGKRLLQWTAKPLLHLDHETYSLYSSCLHVLTCSHWIAGIHCVKFKQRYCHACGHGWRVAVLNGSEHPHTCLVTAVS
jgi:hypothetical protein